MTNSADPDQLASEEANWSGSTLFAKTGHVVFSKRRVKYLLSTWCVVRASYTCSRWGKGHVNIWPTTWENIPSIQNAPSDDSDHCANVKAALNLCWARLIIWHCTVISFFLHSLSPFSTCHYTRTELVNVVQGLHLQSQLATMSENIPSDVCTEQRFRSVCAFVQSN